MEWIAFCLYSVAVIGRNICNIGFIERPLALGLAWWLITGDMSLALPLAVFFELFWLDLFAIGSYVPPVAAFSYLLLLPLAHAFGWKTPGEITLALTLVLPLAYVPVIFEKWQRKHLGGYMRIVRMATRETPIGNGSTRVLMRFAAVNLAGNAALYILTLYMLMYLWGSLVHFTAPLQISWPILYAIAAIGGLMALRIRRAYILFAASLILMTLTNL